jgi:TfoX/Sxy family transcriptional regulator of competence genes
MQVPKPTEDDKDRFRALLPDDSSIQVKPMFGNLSAFVNGNMFAGLFGSSLGIRLVDEADKATLVAIDGAGPFGPAERPMGGYVALPPTWSSTPKLAAPWIAKAFMQVGVLPAKVAKPAKPKAAKKET